mmetsp:Transcript_136705/g.380968  ORF Transcript_136705/g.380968 Transcript_136705/m.380968 type:complete len:603 (-) Transcript_136705:128-1936(-)|eukprot:CAMPEP_0179060482 /NCGR_PEP_ID=MMETSP0796-20121207/25890_1 /TAXON_ID=73915 /ORGANISM="Pyrodinium bahamense, Strain pbaha01" /LENGTH=602 /DNA_ID=CAMNT_0020757269 /DNA_START=26 /DNA_END=1834 /DNA_ORIENTATION=+
MSMVSAVSGYGLVGRAHFRPQGSGQRQRLAPSLQRLLPEAVTAPRKSIIAAALTAVGMNISIANHSRRRGIRRSSTSVSSSSCRTLGPKGTACMRLSGASRFAAGVNHGSCGRNAAYRQWPHRQSTNALAAVESEGFSGMDSLEASLFLGAALGLNTGTGATLVTLSMAIFCHESGHFLCARSVDLPAAEFSLGFGPELLTSDSASTSEAPEDVVEFKDAENDTVRLERLTNDLRVLVNGEDIWRGVPTFDQSTGSMDCGGQGSCKVPHESRDIVGEMLQSAASAQADASRNPKDTIFALRLLPIGGYVQFDERKTVKLADGSMVNQLEALPVLAQLWVYAGGVLANISVAFTTLCIAALTSGVPRSEPRPGIRVASLGEDDVLRTGLNAKDIMLRIGDLDLHAPGQSVPATIDFIHSLPAGQPVRVLVERAGKEFPLDIVPITDAKSGLQRLGVSITTNTERVLGKSHDFLEAAGIAAGTIQQQLGEQLAALKSVLSFSGGSGEVVGPVGIIKQGSDLTEAEGLIGLLMFFVTVNLNLALINALPVPALDGGKIAFAIAGTILGKPVSEERKQQVESVFIVLVLAGLASLTLKDIVKIIQP